MRKSYISLLLLALFSVQASCSFANNFLNAIASKNGESKIAKDEYGLYVEFDVAEEPIAADDTARMLLSFVSPNTLLAGKDCLGFEEYNCGTHNCKVGKDEVDVTYPFFTSRAFKSTIEGHLDRKAWNLTSNTFYTLSCASGTHLSAYGKNRTGVVGFGLEENSAANYQLNNTDKTYFSVALKNLTDGTLYFSTQKSLAAGKAITFKTTSSWKSEAIESTWFLGDQKAVAAVSVIFDIHADAIGLPDSLYKSVLEFFKKHGATCPEDVWNKPECAFTGNVTELPALVFHHQGQNITIPKEIYLQETKTEKPEKIQFNLKELASTHEGQSYIHESFVNTVVLDSNFMSKYYTVFKQGAIEIYGKGGDSPSTGGSGPWLWVGIGAVVVIAAVGVFAFMKKKSSSDDYSRN